ncbi:putative intracellular septation protein A [Pseudoalteromonas holothuriae]|uniref:Inner membrane-spanning protein YciB n=1 Tax=Pseudoalteromonas holothuriae TaxID=2963714 RepID=A0A9W4QSZ2_9GAMM|nr:MULTISPECIES: inner membrane-spanning protein YciB [unclassified Pseudoalteromonas]CAH9051974.1 putative intracellular septation protein A [Pseudoalteromonas sp. CIP111854]CAH9057515.1 putative intracellular septation protein A [Pseudoalteromonas sp. CIP111951]
MAALLEYLPLILFFAVYKFVDIYWATGVLIIASIIQLGFYYLQSGHIATRHWVFFVIALVLGGMTVLFQNEHFIMWKATVIYALLALSLLISRYIFNKNLVEKTLLGLLNTVNEKENGRGSQLEITIPESICEQLNMMWMVFLAFISVLNLYVAYNFSLDTWVNFKVFGLMGITFLAILATMVRIYKYLPDEK